jgi:hypothetical protein
MISLAEVKRRLGLTGTATHDEDLQALINRVVDTVQGELDWYFGPPRPATEYLDCRRGPLMFLRQPPAPGTAVVIDERGAVGDAWVSVSSTLWEVQGRQVIHRTGWPCYGSLRVQYQEGFAELPGDVYDFVLDAVVAKWKGQSLNPSMQSETLGDYSYTRGDAAKSSGWGGLLSRWRRGRV